MEYCIVVTAYYNPFYDITSVNLNSELDSDSGEFGLTNTPLLAFLIQSLRLFDASQIHSILMHADLKTILLEHKW